MKTRKTKKVSPLLRMPLDELGFSVRVRNVLWNLDCHTVGDLLGFSRLDLMRCKNFGRKSLREIDAVLASVGLKLRDSREQTDRLNILQLRSLTDRLAASQRQITESTNIFRERLDGAVKFEEFSRDWFKTIWALIGQQMARRMASEVVVYLTKYKTVSTNEHGLTRSGLSLEELEVRIADVLLVAVGGPRRCENCRRSIERDKENGSTTSVQPIVGEGAGR